MFQVYIAENVLIYENPNLSIIFSFLEFFKIKKYAIRRINYPHSLRTI